MTTAARLRRTAESTHWYTRAGEPFFEMPKKRGPGMKSPDIRDARELHLLPSVTHVLRTMNKPNLNDWITEQAVLAVLTTPRHKGEPDDAFVHRVLHVERVHEEEAARARDLGSRIHAALEIALTNRDKFCSDAELAPYVNPVLDWRAKTGSVVWCEKVLVGNGYAGKADTLLYDESSNTELLVDFKTTGTLPKESYPEHRLQTSAYASAKQLMDDETKERKLWTCNVYLSTSEPGQFRFYLQSDWDVTFLQGFYPLLKLWQWLNKYNPRMP